VLTAKESKGTSSPGSIRGDDYLTKPFDPEELKAPADRPAHPQSEDRLVEHGRQMRFQATHDGLTLSGIAA